MGTVAVLIIVVFVAIGKTWLGARGQTDETLQESASEEEPETDAAEDNSVEDAVENNESSKSAETENTDEKTAADTASTDASEITATHYADIVIENYGAITVALDGNTAPKTVENFVSLAEERFYDGLTFHRIMDGFMMQGGDPNGDGTGGSENTIIGEFEDNGYENPLSHTRGAISMARSNDYDSASSQFFIVHEDSLSLDGQYAVFGYVTEGMDVVDKICTSAEPIDDNGTIPSEEQPVIVSVTIRST
ncbi:MAG: peptidylprolyl isomerase [Lachnospiraceae bacterium]|nr:peptidylprolyl isomerase [Lachnospiraceae bacterium]